MTFQVGDKVAHPLHGAGVIDHIEKRKISGVEREYYVMKLPVGDMLVMVPCESCGEIGVRPIVDSETLEQILSKIPQISVNMTTNWNKRYRENMNRIKSGDLLEVAVVIKGLVYRERERGLSTGERKMLHSAKQILLSEIVLADNSTYEEAEDRLNTSMA